jgi:predicted membrane channel-forming protein YqfA (hemolysin III family)
MLFSACFHLFYCISERAHKVWLSLDMLGVSTGLLGVYLTGIYYSFYCFHMWHNLYLAVFCLLAVVTLAAPLHPEYTAQKYQRYRIGLYVIISLYGILPAVHWVYLNGGWNAHITWRFFPNVLIVYGLSFAAFLPYLFMIPERFLPGKVDFVGWSHQWWHVLVLAALVWWRSAGLDILQYRKTHACHDI